MGLKIISQKKLLIKKLQFCCVLKRKAPAIEIIGYEKCMDVLHARTHVLKSGD